MYTYTKKILLALVFICIGAFFSPQLAEASQRIVFLNEFVVEHNGSAWVIDRNDDSTPGTDLTLQFGTTLNKTIKYEVANSWFSVNANLSLNQNELKNFVVDKRATPPASPIAGQMYYNTVDNNTYAYNGTIWEDLTLLSSNTKVVTVASSGADYTTVASAATFLNSQQGGIILLSAETFPITASIDMSNIIVMGKGETASILQFSGAGKMTVSQSQFINVQLDVNAITATYALDVAAAAKAVQFEKTYIDIQDVGDSLLDSSAGTAPTIAMRFQDARELGANGAVLKATGSGNINVASTIYVKEGIAQNLLRFNNWNLTVEGRANVLTSGILTPSQGNQLFVYAGMNLQAAINSLTSGGVIELLPGTHTISATLTVPVNNMIIKGSGDATIVSASGFTGITSETPAIAVGAIDGTNARSNITLQNFKLEVNNDIHGIRVAGGSDNLIEDIVVKKNAGTSGSGGTAKVGIQILDSTTAPNDRMVVKSCRVEGNGGTIYFTDGIHVSATSGIVSSGIWGFGQGIRGALIEGNTVDYVRETAYVFVKASNSSLFNNRASRMGVSGGYGIYIHDSNTINMTANVFNGSVTTGTIAIGVHSLALAGSVTDSIFNNNIIDGLANGGVGFATGFQVGNASATVHRNVFNNNIIKGADTGVTTAFLLQGDSDDNIIRNNEFQGGTNPWDTGINISVAAVDRTDVAGNKFTNTTTVYTNNGTSTRNGVTHVRATADPVATDDASKGYEIGMMWVNTSTSGVYVLINSTVGAANWQSLAQSGSPVNFTTNPTINDDVGDGYVEGQIWVNTTTKRVFILVDSTAGAALWRSADQDISQMHRAEMQIHEDWISSSTTGNDGWTAAAAGTGAGASVTTNLADANHPGILQLTTGTTATGSASENLGLNALLAGGGAMRFETLIQLPTLSAAAQEYILRVGFGDSNTADFVDGIYFEYNRASTGTNWQMKTANNSTRTTTPTTTAVVAGAWVRLRAEINAPGTSVTYYIDDTNVGTVSTNIPTGAGRQFGPIVHIVKTAGTTARTVLNDYFYTRAEFTTTR